MPGRSGGLQFAAQVPDVGVDGPLVSFEGEAVCRLEQLQAVEDLPGMAQEELEQGELNRCQGERTLVDGCRMAACVERKSAAAKDGGLLLNKSSSPRGRQETPKAAFSWKKKKTKKT